MSSGNKSSSRHIYGLDGLRTLAILGVTLFHVFPATFKGGYLGVLLFFVISGYLLAKTSERKMRQGTFGLGSYYVKRVQRIYPALIVMMLLTTGVYFFVARNSLAGIRREMASILFGYNNWWQIAQNADYFTRITNASPFTHMWFLSIELQFYLVWPLLLIGILWLNKRFGHRVGLKVLCALTVLSAALTPIMYRPENDVTRLYYGTDTRCYALLLGVLLAMLQSRKRIPQIRKELLWVLALPLLGGSVLITFIAYFLMDGQLPFTYLGGMLLMTLLFGGLILLATDRRVPVGRWLDAGPLGWIGQRSYEIYLWQYPVIFLFQYKQWDFIPGFAFLEIALIVALAAWLHWLVDMVLRGGDFRLPEIPFRWQRISLQAASCLTVLIMVFGAIGTGSAASEKFAGKNDLAARLEENQKMLEEQQNNPAPVVVETEPAAPHTASGQILEYADPDLTNSADVSLSRVLMIGDSIMLDSSPQLKEQFPDSYIEAKQNRQASKAVEIGQDMLREGNVNKTVVISLGTNGPITRSTVTKILDVFGPNISIFWVNLFGRTVTWRDEANQLLLDLSKEYTNLTIIDWCSLIRNHPEWLWEDGEHPNIEGSGIYAKLIRESLDVVIAKQREAAAAQASTQAAAPAQESVPETSAGGEAQTLPQA